LGEKARLMLFQGEIMLSVRYVEIWWVNCDFEGVESISSVGNGEWRMQRRASFIQLTRFISILAMPEANSSVHRDLDTTNDESVPTSLKQSLMRDAANSLDAAPRVVGIELYALHSGQGSFAITPGVNVPSL
jgi:hypothetical protein